MTCRRLSRTGCGCVRGRRIASTGLMDSEKPALKYDRDPTPGRHPAPVTICPAFPALAHSVLRIAKPPGPLIAAKRKSTNRVVPGAAVARSLSLLCCGPSVPHPIEIVLEGNNIGRQPGL